MATRQRGRSASNFQFHQGIRQGGDENSNPVAAHLSLRTRLLKDKIILPDGQFDGARRAPDKGGKLFSYLHADMPVQSTGLDAFQ